MYVHTLYGMYVCIYIYIYIFIYLCIDVYWYIWIYTHIYVYIYIYVHECVSLHTHAHTNSAHISTVNNTLAHTHTIIEHTLSFPLSLFFLNAHTYTRNPFLPYKHVRTHSNTRTHTHRWAENRLLGPIYYIMWTLIGAFIFVRYVCMLNEGMYV